MSDDSPSAPSRDFSEVFGYRGYVRVCGPDATSFLQGQLSQDVAAMAVGSVAPSFLLQPTGKVDAWMRVTRVGDDDFLLDVDEGFAKAVVARLERFKLRTKATIEEVMADDDTGAPASERAPRGDDARRIIAGIPAMGAELTPDVIPAELGDDLVAASVSFTKGCYTGQELVARIDSRGGNVPRHLRGLRLEGATVPPVGAEIMVGDRSVGTLTSVSLSADLRCVVALGFVHRSVEVPSTAEVVVDGNRLAASIEKLPLAPA